MKGVFETGSLLLDGSWILDGSETLGSSYLGVIEKSDRIISFGSLERTSVPRSKNVLQSFEQKQLQNVTIMFDNRDKHFGRLLAKEPFLTRTLTVYWGFEDVVFAEHLKLFSGVINQVTMGPEMTLEVVES